MFWTKRNVNKLKAEAAEAQSRIRDLFIRGVISLDEQRRAWGQFLEAPRDNTQYGIYGTSSGIQVLSMAEYRPDHKLILGASMVLDDPFRDGADTNLFLEKGDLSITYKLAYLVEASRPDSATLDTSSQSLKRLIDSVLPGTGWGEYFYSENDKAEHPMLMATASALLAIRRYRDFRISAECRGALAWLCKRVTENGTLGPHELGLTALALTEYRNVGVEIAGYDSAVETCKTRIVDWSKLRKTKQLGTSKVYYYSTSTGDHRENKYLFFLPDCLAAFTLLKLGNPIIVRRCVLRIVHYFVEQIRSRNGFVSALTGNVSTVDQLWIYRLLQEFRNTPVDDLLPQYFFLWSGATAPVRILLALGFLVIALVCSWIAIMTNSVVVRISVVLIGGVAASLLARTLWEFILRGERV